MKLAFWKKNKTTYAVPSENSAEQLLSVELQYDDTGLQYPYQSAAKTDADYYWESLAEEDIAYLLDDHYMLPWDELFELQQDTEHQPVIHLLNLPPVTTLYPVIRSENGLSDSDFQIILAGWCDKSGIKHKGAVKRTGAMITLDGTEYVLNEATWKLLEKNKEFARIGDKNELINKKYWAQISRLAKKSTANLDEFLSKTIVLAPETLQLNLRKNLISTESVVEVQPDFEDSPSNWLQVFDGYKDVQNQYTVSLPEGGIAHIIIKPKVKSVLHEIKKMPNRRITGERAQTFLHNPFAQLGEDAAEVVSPKSFDDSKREAEIYSYRLLIEKMYDERGLFASATLTLQEDSEHEQAPIIKNLESNEHAQHFIKAYERPSPVFIWAGYSVDRSRYLDEQIDVLKRELAEIQHYEDELQAKTVLNLANYSYRVIGIGEAEKLNISIIQKDSGETGWLPENLMPDAKTAEPELQASHEDDSNEDPAEDTLDTASIAEKKKKSTLLIASNIDEAEFTKTRSSQLLFDNNKRPPARLPSSFRSQEFGLKQHQEYGIAWLQNLYQFAPEHIGGCLLADDMGLGKTLQLLCFIGEYLETAKVPKPILVVAPVSLLENWEAEIYRFFSAKFGTVLSLYGDNLKQRKIPKNLISTELKNDYGITNLLEDNWLGAANIVLTTYETMRDLEFSLARVDWSIMICDEAQKIKVPTAMVTKAAKAQKADFKIACTGTPVENSLTDLWCLSDFIQENLLGSLNEFNKLYRRPIERKEDLNHNILEELRTLIAPQVLRRMKHDVAELPAKHEVHDCKNIPISTLQLEQYTKVLHDFKQASQQGGKGMMLGLLHDIRMICAHPLKFQGQATLDASPKAVWLIKVLESIKQKNEKVIIFTEFRDIQVFLKRILSENFDLNVTTVNGDSNTNSRKGATRQGVIDKFQATDGFNVILLSTVAVGFGVNIQKANHVIHYTRSWNPAKEDQATDRAYRIGQDKEVFVYYPSIVAHDFETFEIKLDKLLSSKRNLADDMLKPEVDLKQELINSIH